MRNMCYNIFVLCSYKYDLEKNFRDIPSFILKLLISFV